METLDTGRVSPLPVGRIVGIALGVSGDGSTVVGRLGRSFSALWSFDGTQSVLETPREIPEFANLLNVSDDGSTVVGSYRPGVGNRPFRWSVESGLEALGEQFGTAIATSSDGRVIVGSSASEATRWVVGETIALSRLGDLQGGEWKSLAYDVSADGSTVVGYGSTARGREAFRWTEESGMVGLGFTHRLGNASQAFAVSGDGSRVVGVSSSLFDFDRAFIWDSDSGMRTIETFLLDECEFDLSGWHLTAARGISGDGRTIVGIGLNPSFHHEGWLVRLPEPSRPEIVALAALALLSAVRSLHRARPRIQL